MHSLKTSDVMTNSLVKVQNLYKFWRWSSVLLIGNPAGALLRLLKLLQQQIAKRDGDSLQY